MEKRICIVTTTRADWGLLMPLARRLAAEPAVRLQLVASNMHLMPEFGMTVNEITDAGFTVDERVEMAVAGDDEASRVRAMAMCLGGMAGAFERLRPDCVVLLGDRYEMLAVASAAAVMRLPIVHIAGGEVSEGAVDDSIRHAITKLSTLHLTATEAYRRRVIQMGEAPDTVVNTGAIGVWNAFNIKPLDRNALEDFLDLRLDGDIAVVTYHPATNDSSASPAEQTSALYEVLALLYYAVSVAAVVVVVMLYQSIWANQREKLQNELLAAQMGSIQQHIRQVEYLYQDIRSIKHDMANHLLTLERLYAGNKEAEAKAYSAELSAAFSEAAGELRTGNPVTDVILQEQKNEAQNRNLEFHSAFQYPSGTTVNAFDVSIILNNALQNAVEYAIQYVDIRAYRKNNAYIIEVKNDFAESLKWDT